MKLGVGEKLERAPGPKHKVSKELRVLKSNLV